MLSLANQRNLEREKTQQTKMKHPKGAQFCVDLLFFSLTSNDTFVVFDTEKNRTQRRRILSRTAIVWLKIANANV